VQLSRVSTRDLERLSKAKFRYQERRGGRRLEFDRVGNLDRCPEGTKAQGQTSAPSTFLAKSSRHAASDEWSSTCAGMRELP
jgi:hypothetical protein